MIYGSRSLIFNAKSASCKRHAISSDRTDRVTRKIYCDTRASEKMSRAHGGCLGTGSRRRARQAAISPGEAQTAFDPGMPEWGNPAGVMPSYPGPNQIGPAGTTGGTETSKYPEEEKSPASSGERKRASPNRYERSSLGALPYRGRGSIRAGAPAPACGHKGAGKRNGMERPAAAGESPVRQSLAPRRMPPE